MNKPPVDPAALAHSRQAFLAGDRDAARRGILPRPVIGASWHRMLRSGLDPERGNPAALLDADELEHRRRATRIGEVLDTLREGLSALCHAGSRLLVVCDADGHVLWRDGSRAMCRAADRLTLTEGACWAEEVTGTNAIGTALVARGPVQVHSAEHFVRALHPLTCAAAPLHDPRDGRLIGAVDVTCPAAARPPATTLALVTAVARVAEGELRLRHWQSVDRLRSVAAPILARIGGRAYAVDRDGWTAAVTGTAPVERIALPDAPVPGEVWLPSLGRCVLEPLPGGWLVRPAPGGGEPGAVGRILVDLSAPRSWSVSVHGPCGSWTRSLSPRHAELLLALALRPEGSTAAQLAADLFGDASRAGTVRAELSRLRRQLSSVLAQRPYRFADTARVRLRRPADPLDLLPFSTAPVVLAARAAG